MGGKTGHDRFLGIKLKIILIFSESFNFVIVKNIYYKSKRKKKGKKCTVVLVQNCVPTGLL